MNTDKIYAEQLANEYAPKDTSKVVALRKLDNKVKLPATIFTYTFGVITALVAGEGICLSMKVIGSGATAMFVLGVIAGIIGLLGMGVNYPICKKLLAQGKQKSWSWPKRSANSKPWDGRGSSCKSCCISYYGTPLQRPCFSRMHQLLSGDCGQPFLCGVPRHGCHPLCLGMVSLHGGLQ